MVASFGCQWHTLSTRPGDQDGASGTGECEAAILTEHDTKYIQITR